MKVLAGLLILSFGGMVLILDIYDDLIRDIRRATERK